MARRARKGRRTQPDDVFYAIADPTRRALLNQLAGGEQPVSHLAQRFAITRAAVSQHLAILRNTGLVVARRAGRRQRYQLRARPLARVYSWVASYERFWSDRLKALGEHLRSTR